MTAPAARPTVADIFHHVYVASLWIPAASPARWRRRSQPPE